MKGQERKQSTHQSLMKIPAINRNKNKRKGIIQKSQLYV